MHEYKKKYWKKTGTKSKCVIGLEFDADVAE